MNSNNKFEDRLWDEFSLIFPIVRNKPEVKAGFISGVLVAKAFMMRGKDRAANLFSVLEGWLFTISFIFVLCATLVLSLTNSDPRQSSLYSLLFLVSSLSFGSHIRDKK